MKEEIDFEVMKTKAVEQLKAGKPLLGKDGAFAPLLESVINAVEGYHRQLRKVTKNKGVFPHDAYSRPYAFSFDPMIPAFTFA